MVGKRAAGAIKMAAPRSRCWWTVVRIERQREHHLRRARRVPLPRDGVISQTPTNQSKHTEHADAELTAEFCKRSSQDAKLLEWANGTLDEFVTQDPDAHQLLVARFNKRCRKLARRNAIFDKLRGFARWNRNLMLNR